MLRIIAILFFIFILVNLFMALVAMVRNKEGSHDVVKALTYRIAASIVLFILIVAGTLITQNYGGG